MTVPMYGKNVANSTQIKTKMKLVINVLYMVDVLYIDEINWILNMYISNG